MGVERRREKSLRIGVHHANAVVWGPVYRTRLLDGGGESQRPGSAVGRSRTSSRRASSRASAARTSGATRSRSRPSPGLRSEEEERRQERKSRRRRRRSNVVFVGADGRGDGAARAATDACARGVVRHARTHARQRTHLASAASTPSPSSLCLSAFLASFSRRARVASRRVHLRLGAFAFVRREL